MTGAVTTPLTQVVEALGVRATVTLVGKLSTSAPDVSATVLGLVRVIVRVDGMPRPTELGLNALAMVTGERTSSVAVAGTGLLAMPPPAVAVTAPAAMVFR